jgi:hypothetical protein
MECWRPPQRQSDGSRRKRPTRLEWKPLRNPEIVNESIIARATAKNPVGAAKLSELTDLRPMPEVVAGHAIREIQEAMPGAVPESALKTM